MKINVLREREEGGSPLSEWINDICCLYLLLFFTRKSTAFVKQNWHLDFGFRWKLGATELLWPYKWHGSLPGADSLQLSPLHGSSCCERSCQLYSVHHGQSLHTMFLLYEQKSCFCIILIWYKACYLNELNVKPNDLFSILHIIHTCIIRSKLHSISFIDYKDFWQ